MAYSYKIKAVGIKLDLDDNPPSIATLLFPNGGWTSVSVDADDKCYEFVFEDKQVVEFSNPLITITETDLTPPAPAEEQGIPEFQAEPEIPSEESGETI